MSYLPALPSGGYLGWMTLKRTASQQQGVYANQPQVKREEAYFREKIGKVKTAEALVSDRRLLSVALGAFGLEDDINNRYFIRKVLEGGTLTTTALASRLSDKRYYALSAAFGFGDVATPLTQISDFADKIVKQWKERGFEAAVGQLDDSLRLALNLERELGKISRQGSSETQRWFTVMAQPPLRKVFETVFSLPTAFGLLDIDRQRTILSQKAKALFGESDVAQFTDPAKMEGLVRRYLLKTQAAATQISQLPGQAALMLLSQSARR